jgi:hypothetical protein
LIGLLERRQAELLSAAWPLGRRIYAEDPDAFVARIEAYWAVWRGTGVA